MEYKERLGARSMRRTPFVRTVRRSRIETPDVRLALDGERINCRDVIDSRPSSVAAVSAAARGAEEGRARHSNGTGKNGNKLAAGASDRSGSPPKRRKKEMVEGAKGRSVE